MTARPQLTLAEARELGQLNSPVLLPCLACLLPHDSQSEVEGGGSQVGQRILKHRILDETGLEQILGEVAFGGGGLCQEGVATEEVVRAGKVDVEIELHEHTELHLKDLFFGKGSLRTRNEVLDTRRVNLFVLAGNEHGSDPDELQLSSLNVHGLEESID